MPTAECFATVPLVTPAEAQAVNWLSHHVENLGMKSTKPNMKQAVNDVFDLNKGKAARSNVLVGDGATGQDNKQTIDVKHASAGKTGVSSMTIWYTAQRDGSSTVVRIVAFGEHVDKSSYVIKMGQPSGNGPGWFCQSNNPVGPEGGGPGQQNSNNGGTVPVKPLVKFRQKDDERQLAQREIDRVADKARTHNKDLQEKDVRDLKDALRAAVQTATKGDLPQPVADDVKMISDQGDGGGWATVEEDVYLSEFGGIAVFWTPIANSVGVVAVGRKQGDEKYVTFAQLGQKEFPFKHSARINKDGSSAE
ncbi:hypothetical protein BJF83_24645 [Nocardiopsis sp. CNR-923]|uniref:hypothetical protein n=1 Tax=Nocardiopsis sp. CNR-923 TaxID=1904965 RepID=UPI000962E278|nr:hypothetical protein [Nocardiopsis sp. CNR-923]OLT30689.1 hypothetical protein BJF83_24645 [Nocardiopsis sp. CNR-923]